MNRYQTVQTVIMAHRYQTVIMAHRYQTVQTV